MSKSVSPEALAIIESATKIVITAHDRPDGDAIGATLGLARILREQGKMCYLTGCEPVSEIDQQFLYGDAYAPIPEDVKPADEDTLLICLDCGSAERAVVVPEWLAAGGRVLNVDHHHSNTMFGEVNEVDAQASSSSELVMRLADAAGWAVPESAAEVLWLGLVCDTGRFTYENSSPAALACAARLMECGAKPWEVGGKLYQSKSEEKVRIEARAASTLEFYYDGRLACVSLSQQDFDEFGCGTDVAGDVVNIPRSIRGVEISFFFYEMNGGAETKLSIRSAEPFDATVLAKRFDGGGHKRAAGCSLPVSLDDAKREAFAAVEELWGELVASRA
jgi:phosphoesterase RecJ-like protein